MLKRIWPVILLLIAGCSQSLIHQGRELADEGNYDRAIDLYYQELAAHPQHIEMWRELGIVFYKKGDLDRAEDALKQAPKNDPAVHLYLGLVHEARGDLDKAINAYSAALKLNPGGDTRSMLQTHLDKLIVKNLDHQVTQAVEHESEIKTSNIPPNTIAVVDFDGSKLDPKYAPIARGLAELTAVDLAKVKSLRLVERLKIDLLMQELKLGASEYVEPSQAPRMGRLLGSSKIITGSVIEVGKDRLRLDGAIVDTRDSTADYAEPAEGQLEKFFAVQKELVFKVLGDLDVKLTAEERKAIQEFPTESFLALMAFSKGLDFRSRGMYKAAEQEFERAVHYDNGFAPAREQLQLSASLSAANVSPAQLEAAATAVQSATQASELASRLDWLASRADEHKSNIKRPPEPGGTGTVNITGDLDGQ
jgi:tetratricopeptide (TPR) repeat protein